MRLQSDPTIIYGIVGGKGRLDRPITKQDIAQKTPYNTYRINGLPPGPISNPGRAAIAAVLNPPDTKELYFVADGTGGHAFAENLDQHKINVEAWRKIERERQAGQEAEDIADAKQETGDEAADAAAAAAATASDAAAATPEPAPDAAAAAPEPDAPTVDALAPAPVAAEGVAAPLPEPKPMPDIAELETAEVSVAAAPEPPAVETALKPGDVVTVDKRLVPIPVPKPKQ
jgi:UPF0755 protein